MTAPFELKMTEQEAFEGLKKQFVTEFTLQKFVHSVQLMTSHMQLSLERLHNTKLVKVSGILQLPKKL